MWRNFSTGTARGARDKYQVCAKGAKNEFDYYEVKLSNHKKVIFEFFFRKFPMCPSMDVFLEIESLRLD